MTILSRTEQTGRSMVEMLGVLAIIGVLSVGGISGYSKAMAKYKLTRAQDQITMLLMNIRTAFASSPSYAGLTTTAARDFNIAPSEMFGAASGQLVNAFGGGTYVFACNTTEGGVGCSTANSSVTADNGVQYFGITMTGLGREVCTNLATSDWGTDGLMGIYVSGGTAKKWDATQLPIPFSEIGNACAPSGEYSSITWVYY